MSMIAISSWLIGAVLGTRFRVHVLLPATILGLVLVAAIAALKGSTLASAGISAVIFMMALQLGYLGGLATRSILAAARLPAHRDARSTIVRS